MNIRAMRSVPLALAIVALVSCGDEASNAPAELGAQDPLLARALNDPLMVDPDLSWRSEANAAISIRDGHPLPLFSAREDSASRAREAARVELLEDGQIPAVPLAATGSGSPSLASLTTANEILEALAVRPDCVAAMDGQLSWSTRMPGTSSIMPHGMVQQAAGVDMGECVVRVVRYLTPASVSDVLEYHYAKVDRARFRIERFDAPEVQLRADRRDQALAVHVRDGANGMTEVDVVHWRK